MRKNTRERPPPRIPLREKCVIGEWLIFLMKNILTNYMIPALTSLHNTQFIIQRHVSCVINAFKKRKLKSFLRLLMNQLFFLQWATIPVTLVTVRMKNRRTHHPAKISKLLNPPQRTVLPCWNYHHHNRIRKNNSKRKTLLELLALLFLTGIRGILRGKIGAPVASIAQNSAEIPIPCC